MEYWKQLLGTVLLSLVGLVVYQILAFTERHSVKKTLDGCQLLFDKATELYQDGIKRGYGNALRGRQTYIMPPEVEGFFSQTNVYKRLSQDKISHLHLINAYGRIAQKLITSLDALAHHYPILAFHKGQSLPDTDFILNYLNERVQSELPLSKQYDAESPTRFAYEDEYEDRDMSSHFSIDLELFTMALFTYKLLSEPQVGRFSYDYKQELTILATYDINYLWDPFFTKALKAIRFDFDHEYYWGLTEQRLVTRLLNIYNWDFFPLNHDLAHLLGSLIKDKQFLKSESLIKQVEPILRGHMQGDINFYLSGLLPLLWSKLDHYYALQNPKMILEVAEEILSYPDPDQASMGHDLYTYVEFQYDSIETFDVMIKKTEALMQLKRPKQALLALNEAMQVLNEEYYVYYGEGPKFLMVQQLAIDILKANHYYIASRDLVAYRDKIYALMTK